MLENLLRPSHLLLLAIAALLLFGPSKLPELGRSFGTMLREFKRSVRGDSAGDKQPETGPLIEETAQEKK
ncbi:twin-arginine translocase TatA/TatE family subunit [Paenibacillus pinistramenti]|uniref:twin-arginine translocase TatA/TatE family subunit n=1 Tax=Paenibacillus pinistramenti TaxID=1768003 RepID=UPI001108B078|nr:twin-arginine translocase TatA/TatE family subunit [Paenibacillus pinistramenti]